MPNKCPTSTQQVPDECPRSTQQVPDEGKWVMARGSRSLTGGEVLGVANYIRGSSLHKHSNAQHPLLVFSLKALTWNLSTPFPRLPFPSSFLTTPRHFYIIKSRMCILQAHVLLRFKKVEATICRMERYVDAVT